MVYVIHDCHCGLCLGGQPAPIRLDGEMVFGGSICNCRCHDLKGKEREDFIKLKNELDSNIRQGGKG